MDYLLHMGHPANPHAFSLPLLLKIKGVQNHCILTRESICQHALSGNSGYCESVFTGLITDDSAQVVQFLQDSTVCGRCSVAYNSLQLDLVSQSVAGKT